MTNHDLPERLSQDDGGTQADGDRRNAEVADWLRSCGKADVPEPAGELTSPHGLIDEEHIAAERFALERGCWIDNPYTFGMLGPDGDENECFVSPDGTIVFKVNMLTHSGGSILRVFEKVAAHNAIFPETRYDFVGFTNMRFARSAFPIFRQPFVKDAERATPDEIAAHMQALGFLPDPSKSGGWRNATMIVWDLLPKNVLKDEAGNIYVIDAEIEVF